MKKKVLSSLLVASMVATMFTGCGDKKEAPTLFQINGQVGYQSWKDYWLDFKDSKVYGELTNDDFYKMNVSVECQKILGLPNVSAISDIYDLLFKNALGGSSDDND